MSQLGPAADPSGDLLAATDDLGDMPGNQVKVVYRREIDHHPLVEQLLAGGDMLGQAALAVPGRAGERDQPSTGGQELDDPLGLGLAPHEGIDLRHRSNTPSTRAAIDGNQRKRAQN